MSETKYCPYCGNVIDTDSVFCGTCGGNVNETANPPPVQSTPQPQYIPPVQTSQRMYSTTLVPKTQTSSPTALGIIGLIVNIITFAGLSWGCWLVRLDRFYIVIIYFVIGIAGIIMSSIAIKKSKTLGIVGLILGILGTLPILGALGIILLYYLLSPVLI